MPRTPEEIRDISVEVYKKLLAVSAGGNDAKWKADAWRRMVEKDGDGGEKLRGRAGIYDHIVRATLEVVENG